jgi:hypothetical protein
LGRKQKSDDREQKEEKECRFLSSEVLSSLITHPLRGHTFSMISTYLKVLKSSSASIPSLDVFGDSQKNTKNILMVDKSNPPR